MSSLLHACVQFGDDAGVRRLRVLAGTARLYPVLQRLGSQFSAATGIPLYFNFSTRVGATGALMRAAIAAPSPVIDTPDASGGLDAIITAPSYMPLMDEGGKLLDLSELVEMDQQLRWHEIGSTLRSQMVVYGNKVVAIPVTTAPSFLFYHAPTFERDGLQVPATWDAVLALAEEYNGRDFNGDGKPDYGICITPPNCFVDGTLLQWVLFSLVQTQGPGQGLFLDPATMANLANTTAMAEALEVMRRIRLAGPRFGDCSVFEDAEYLRGNCLLSITTPITFKTAYSPDAPPAYAAMRGRMGMAAYPGSTRVLDRPTGRMVDCDETTCPLARVKAMDTNGVLRPVNQPVPSNNVIVMINAQSPPKYQFYAYSLFSYLTSPQVLGSEGDALLLDPRLETAPLRGSDLTPESAALWVDRGYHPSDVKHFFEAYRAALENPNQAYEPRFVGNLNVSTICSLAAIVYTNATPGYQPPPVSVPVAMIARSVAAVVEANGGRDVFAAAYRQTLNWAPPPAPPPPAPAMPVAGWDSGRGGEHVRTTTIAVVVPCGVAALLALATLIVALKRSVHKRRRQGVVAAPGAGPDTTILVTDIQSSTSLWEHLDSGVMDHALSIHHAVLRTAIADWGGYESATEGDSFIVAFPDPTSALGCALAAQQALLSAPWPPGLLAAPPLPGLEGDEQPLAELAALPTNRHPKGPARTFRGAGDHVVRTAQPRASPATPLRQGPLRPGLDAPSPSRAADLEIRRPEGLGGCADSLLQALPECCGLRPRHDAVAVSSDGTWMSLGHHTPASAPSAAADPPALGALASARELNDSKSGTFDDNLTDEQRPSLDLGSIIGPLTGSRKTMTGEMHPTVLLSCAPEPQVSTTLTLADSIRAGWQLIHDNKTPGAAAEPSAHRLPTRQSRTLSGNVSPTTAPTAAHAGLPPADAVVLFRGLRVRMGMWTGVGSAADVNVNAASGRTQYSGDCLRYAKAVADTAHGGMVVLTEASRARLDPVAVRSSKYVLLYGGLHEVAVSGGGDGSGHPQLHIYMAYSAQLLPRCLAVRPLRSEVELRPGVLAAPVGHGAVVQMRIVGTEALLAWDADVAAAAFQQLHSTALQLLSAPALGRGTDHHRGHEGRAYVAAGHATLLPSADCRAPRSGAPGPGPGPGCMTVVFPDAECGVSWAAAVRRAGLELSWPPQLLEQELAEEVWTTAPGNAGFGNGYRYQSPSMSPLPQPQEHQLLPAGLGLSGPAGHGPSSLASAPNGAHARYTSGRSQTCSQVSTGRRSRFSGGTAAVLQRSPVTSADMGGGDGAVSIGQARHGGPVQGRQASRGRLASPVVAAAAALEEEATSEEVALVALPSPQLLPCMRSEPAKLPAWASGTVSGFADAVTMAGSVASVAEATPAAGAAIDVPAGSFATGAVPPGGPVQQAAASAGPVAAALAPNARASLAKTAPPMPSEPAAVSPAQLPVRLLSEPPQPARSTGMGFFAQLSLARFGSEGWGAAREVMAHGHSNGGGGSDGGGSRLTSAAGGCPVSTEAAVVGRQDSEPGRALRLLYRGLRLRFGVAAGPLKGGLAAGDVSGQVSYGGKAAMAAAKLAAKAKAGQICATPDLARTLPAALASELTLPEK